MDLIAVAIFMLAGISAGLLYAFSRGLERLRGPKD